MKKGFKFGAMSLAALLVFGVAGCGKKADPLPEARIDTCASNNYGATCSSITSENLTDYLDRKDVMYVDLRNFGDYNKSHLEGFENVQFFADIYGDSTQLFNSVGNLQYMPRYETSVAQLEEIFPKNKTIFFMCQSGARVAHMMKIMELNGWDMSKVYNVGGMNDFKGDEYKDMVVAAKAVTFKTGVDTETDASNHTYKTIANVTVDAEGKITSIYVTGTEYTASAAGNWTPETWVDAKYDFVQKLVGKTKAQVEALLDNNGKADGADVVTGATTTSNRVYKAVIAALNS